MMKLLQDQLYLKDTNIEEVVKQIKNEMYFNEFNDNKNISFEIYVSAGALRIRIYEVSYHD